MSRSIPVPSEPLLIRSGQINPIWWRYLQGLRQSDSSADFQQQIDRLRQEIESLPEAAEILGPMSVQVYQQPEGALTLQLSGDRMGVLPGHYYGTSASGGRGFHPLPEHVGGSLPVVTGEILNGQPVFVYADDGSLIYSEVA